MTSSQSIVNFILEQISGFETIIAKKMFGEYAIYCNEKIVALICDNQLFIKPTKAGRAFINDLVEDCPYPGAKPYFLISAELWDNHEWLSTLFKISYDELPPPKKKFPKFTK